MATGKKVGRGAISPIRDIPATPGGVEYVRHRLRKTFKDHNKLVEAGIDCWLRQKAYLERWKWTERAAKLAVQDDVAVTTPPVSKWLDLYRRRLQGIDRAGAFHLIFDVIHHELKLLDGSTRLLKLNTKGTVLAEKTHAHEWAATAVYNFVPVLVTGGKGDRKTTSVEAQKMPHPHAPSLFNKALCGHPGCTRELGIAFVTNYQFPVAHVDERWTVSPQTKCIEAVRPPALPSVVPLDAADFFVRLQRDNKLPLASENDVLLFMMALASPLLRDLLSGQLGVYWFTGPSGAGKDLLAELLSDIWSTTNPFALKVKFELALVGEEEQRRSFAAAGDSLYARAKEAGKDIRTIDRLIRLGGTDIIAARDLYRQEINIRNTYTYIADSVEGLPDRREISRRTVPITVAHIDDSTSKGAVLQEILRSAPAIIADLKRRLEQKPPEWYLRQADTKSRPLGPASLARLFGAVLPEVAGKPMDELFEAMAMYVAHWAGEEGADQLSKARPDKEAREGTIFPSYRLSHMVDEMKTRAGYQQVFKQYSSQRQVEMSLEREANYCMVKQGKFPYLPVEIGNRRYAFKLIRAGRNFILIDEEAFCAKTGITPVSRLPPQTSPLESSAGASTEQPDEAASQLSFADADLLSVRAGKP